MPDSWTRPRSLSASGAIGSELVAEARAPAGEPWILLVGEDETALQEAAATCVAGLGEIPLLAPPSEPVLPIALHRLPSPGISGPRALLVERLDRAFFDTLARGAFSASSPLYLLPMLASRAGEGAPLSFVATAIASELESRAASVLAQRGLASRFEIRRVPDSPVAPRVEAPSPESPVIPANLDTCLELGLATRDPAVRARAYEAALELAPESALVHLFLASSLLERGRPAEARASLQEALGRDPDLPAAYYELGKVAIQTDDMDQALAAFTRTTELLPEYASAWGNLGAALGELERREEAADALEHAVALDPLNPALHSNLGVAFRDQGRLDEAEAAFEDALAIAPDFVFGHYNLAGVLYLKGHYPEAIERFEAARSMDRSRSPRQSLLLATARLASGDVQGALRDYEEVFSRLDGQMLADMRTVAEWDLRQLAERAGVSPPLKEAAALLRSIG